MKTEAQIGVKKPQAKECLQPPEAGKGRDFPLEPPEEVQPCDTLILAQ